MVSDDTTNLGGQRGDTLIWSLDAYSQTAGLAASEFAAFYFAEPRKAEWVDAAAGTFRLVDGNATYRVVLDAGEPGRRAAVYQVWRVGQ